MEPIPNEPTKTLLRFGLWVSLALSIITFVTFGVALMAVPNSGTFCPGDCFEYPYLNIISEYPVDFIWMYPALVLEVLFLIWVVWMHHITAKEKQLFSHIALIFAIISGIILVSTYFIQITVIPASLMNNETEGIPLFVQYNPHGMFIAFEELGYLFMSLSFWFIPYSFNRSGGYDIYIRWIFRIAFLMVLVSFIIITIQYGVMREDRFEVIIISINWLTLIIVGILISLWCQRKLKSL
jgi:hypothetical protein